MNPPRIDRVTVTLKNGKKGKGKTLREALRNAVDKSKAKAKSEGVGLWERQS
jgi:hypothetical protein